MCPVIRMINRLCDSFRTHLFIGVIDVEKALNKILFFILLIFILFAPCMEIILESILAGSAGGRNSACLQLSLS